MARRYEDLVEVRPAPDGERPGSFLWHGRLYVVRDVLGHWRERRAWWASAAARAVHGEGDGTEPGGALDDLLGTSGGKGPDGEGPDGEETEDAAWSGAGSRRAALGREREVWRVEASRGRTYGSGVFDLCREVFGAGPVTEAACGDAWRLVRVAD